MDRRVYVAKVFRRTRLGLIVQRRSKREGQGQSNGKSMFSAIGLTFKRGVLKLHSGQTFYRVTIIEIGPLKITLLF